MRSAEHERISSCSFADHVARLSIEEFRRNCPIDIDYRQTVLSSILLRDVRDHVSTKSAVKVVAFGVGTKAIAYTDFRRENFSRDLIRDCHAEVLARRAFLKYLMAEAAALYSHETILGESPFKMNSLGFLSLVDGCSFHLYTSSQACGNATIKRWAKAKKPIRHDLLALEIPHALLQHMRLEVTARIEGEVAVLLKRDAGLSRTQQYFPQSELQGIVPTTDILFTKRTPCIENEVVTELSKGSLNEPGTSTASTRRYVCPPGTATTDSGHGFLMTCSDKIAKWNALGLQGSLLSNFFEPIYLESITVGRKYGQRYCERALCCR